MINLEPIAKQVQKRLFEKMRAVGRETSYSDSPTDVLTQQEMLTRTTFIKMCSGQTPHVILMGGEMTYNATDPDGYGAPGYEQMTGGYRDIYGSRIISRPKDWDEWTEGPDTENPIKRPMPGIKSIDVQFVGGMKAARKATISWTCWSFDDINRLKSHFLTHGNDVLLEWGWVYNKDSLINLPTFIDQKNGIRNNAYKNYIGDVEDAKGDFDVMIGTISNFEYTTRADGGFDCQTILMSVGVRLIESTIPNKVHLKEGHILKVSSKEETKEVIVKLKEATKKDGDVLGFDLNLTLKEFINNLDVYIGKDLKDNYSANIEKYNEESIHSDSESTIIDSLGFAPNKFIASMRAWSDDLTNSQTVRHGYAWVRWGWFEDNVLSKFISMTTVGEKNNNVITQLRSIEYAIRSLIEGDAVPVVNGEEQGPNGEKVKTNSLGVRYYKPIIVKKGKRNNGYESVKIRSSKFLETINLDYYILPGKFKPQGVEVYDLGPNDTITLPGDSNFLKKLANLTNNKEYFRQFEVEGDTKKGYLRNMLINTKVIKDAFGTNETEGVEYLSIKEAMDRLFGSLNTPIPLWKFELRQDEIDHDRVKILDDQTVAVDFTKPIITQKTTLNDTGSEIDNLGIFYFPVWSHNSIVKSQNVSAKVPDEMQLITMYGSNLDQLKNMGKPEGWGQVAGLLAGGLGNEAKDDNKEGLDFAFRQLPLQEIGNANGFANEPITPSGGKSHGVTTFIYEKSDELKKKLEAHKGSLEKKNKVYVESETDFDKDKPTPLLSYLKDDEIIDYFKKATLDQKSNLEDTYGNKYEGEINKKDLKLKEGFIKTIKYMVNDTQYEKEGGDKNTPFLVPLEMELEIDGTGGIYPGNSYHSTYLPQDYQDTTVFQMFEVNHKLDSNTWTTSIIGKMRTTLGQVFKEITKDKQLKDIIDNYNKKKNDGKPVNPRINLLDDDGEVSDAATDALNVEGDIPLEMTTDVPGGDGPVNVDEIFENLPDDEGVLPENYTEEEKEEIARRADFWYDYTKTSNRGKSYIYNRYGNDLRVRGSTDSVETETRELKGNVIEIESFVDEN